MATIPTTGAKLSIHKRTQGLFWTGVIMMGIGSGFALTSSAFISSDPGTSLGLAVTGLLLMVPGIILWAVAGTNRVDVEPR